MPRDVETGEDKDNKKRLLHYKMHEQDKFISRSYWLCATLFFITGIAMVTAVLQGLYKEIALAQTLMITVFGVSYMIILMVMCFCRNNDTLRVPFLLFISFFISKNNIRRRLNLLIAPVKTNPLPTTREGTA